MENFHIQPIVDLASNSVCGGEILWRPNGENPSREEFEALDEDPIVNLKVTQDSFQFALQALDRLQSSAWLSVNLSCRYIGSGKTFFKPISQVIPDLDALRRKAGKRLVVEISEKGIAGHEESGFIRDLSYMHDIAIDDFGTGDAPLSHMVCLDFKKVKVDRSIISGIDSDVYKQRFLKLLVAGCHSIGAEVCAEGIETDSELSFCRRIGVNHGQGWLWSKAIPLERFESLLVPTKQITESLGRLFEAS